MSPTCLLIEQQTIVCDAEHKRKQTLIRILKQQKKLFLINDQLENNNPNLFI